MKSFKEYLTESKKVYEFKIKLAGDYDRGTADKIRKALSMYKCETCSNGKRLPIAETHSDFPELKNTNVTIFDVKLAYPTNSAQVAAAVSEALRCQGNAIKVRNMLEEDEYSLNHAFDEKSGDASLGKDYEASNNQHLVGEKQKMSLLKDLAKTKHELKPYKV